MQPINVVWFKRDLRINDNAPFFEAARAGNVLPLYIVEPKLWLQPDSSRRHWHFIHDSLVELQESLTHIGSKLIIRVGEALDVFQQLLAILGAFNLWSHEETGNNWTYQRDISVKAWCRSKGINWHEFPCNGVVRCLKSRDGWAKQRDTRMASPIISIPNLLHNLQHGIESHELPHKNHPIFGNHSIGSVQEGGRKEALQTLSSFLKERGRNYMQTISKPGVSARHCSA